LPVKDDFVTLHPVWKFATASAVLLGGCATGLSQIASAQVQGTRAAAPIVASPLPSAQAPVRPQYPQRATSPPAPRLTIAGESLPEQQASATSTPLGPPPLSLPAQAPPQDGLAPAPGDLFAPSQIVAQVGDQIILYGDVAPMVNQVLAPHLAKARTRFDRSEIEAQREPLTEQAVKSVVESKLLYQEFWRQIPRDKLSEAQSKIRSQVREKFFLGLEQARKEVAAAPPDELEKVLRRDPVLMRLALLMKQKQLETPAELDAVLRSGGSSLEKQITQFAEHHLGQQVLFSNITLRPEVAHDEMLAYYREHAAEFAVKAKARFEILSVYYDGTTREAADQKIRAMGNAVYFGTPFAAVARRDSQDPNAPQGGVYDWTNQGSLASKVIDEAVFSLPIGKLSQVLYDERGCHIVRVIERQEATRIPFTEAQAKIKEAIQQEKRSAEVRKYLEQLRKVTPVWTIYDQKNGAQEQDSPRPP
jgi:hypothetical protein